MLFVPSARYIPGSMLTAVVTKNKSPSIPQLVKLISLRLLNAQDIVSKGLKSYSILEDGDLLIAEFLVSGLDPPGGEFQHITQQLLA